MWAEEWVFTEQETDSVAFQLAMQEIDDIYTQAAITAALLGIASDPSLEVDDDG